MKNRQSKWLWFSLFVIALLGMAACNMGGSNSGTNGGGGDGGGGNGGGGGGKPALSRLTSAKTPTAPPHWICASSTKRQTSNGQPMTSLQPECARPARAVSVVLHDWPSGLLRGQLLLEYGHAGLLACRH